MSTYIAVLLSVNTAFIFYKGCVIVQNRIEQIDPLTITIGGFVRTSRQRNESKPIPAEANCIALYVDVGPESQEAIKLLAQIGIPMDVVFCTREEEEHIPTVVYRGWQYWGLEKIRTLFEQIKFDLKKKRNAIAVHASTPVKFSGRMIGYDRLDKPLDEITAADVPPGLDADSVCALNPDGSLMLTRAKAKSA